VAVPIYNIWLAVCTAACQLAGGCTNLQYPVGGLSDRRAAMHRGCTNLKYQEIGFSVAYFILIII